MKKTQLLEENSSNFEAFENARNVPRLLPMIRKRLMRNTVDAGNTSPSTTKYTKDWVLKAHFEFINFEH